MVGTESMVHIRHRREELAMAKKGQRTTHRSVAGTKLYAKRDAKGQFKDIQSYKRAHGQDIDLRGLDKV
jgi:hypothetical protein